MTYARKTIFYSALPPGFADPSCSLDAEGDCIVKEADNRFTPFDGVKVVLNANVPTATAARLLRKIANQIAAIAPEPETVFLPVPSGFKDEVEI